MITTDHFEYLDEDYDKAMAIFGLLSLLAKFGIGYRKVTFHTAWGSGDITLSAEYRAPVSSL